MLKEHSYCCKSVLGFGDEVKGDESIEDSEICECFRAFPKIFMEQMVWIKIGLSLEFGATFPNQRVHLNTRLTGLVGDEVLGFGSGFGGV